MPNTQYEHEKSDLFKYKVENKDCERVVFFSCSLPFLPVKSSVNEAISQTRSKYTAQCTPNVNMLTRLCDCHDQDEVFFYELFRSCDLIAAFARSRTTPHHIERTASSALSESFSFLFADNFDSDSNK